MTTKGDSLANKVQSSFRKLSVVASDLNLASDDLGKPVGELDHALKKLNLGLEVWVPVKHQTDDSGNHWSEDLGYAKIGGKWGIALRKCSGNYDYPEEDSVEVWLFSDGPRSLRLSAIAHIPELLEELSAEGERTAKRVREKIVEVQEVAAALKKAGDEPALGWVPKK